MTDPRTRIIEKRLEDVKEVVAVSSGKGGVGKSMVASTLALVLAKRGYRVGLFDLDFTSPSTHLILNVGKLQPKEEKGIIPPRVHGMQYMSIVYYAGELAAPLRGSDISNVLIELLAITRWNSLDFLIIDMPPGISDSTLDMIRLTKKTRFLIVTTPSKLAWETVRKFIDLLTSLDAEIAGVIENMETDQPSAVEEQTASRKIVYWGRLPFDCDLERAIGDVDKLLETRFCKRLKEIVQLEAQSSPKAQPRPS